jgi:hypothetical protein
MGIDGGCPSRDYGGVAQEVVGDAVVGSSRTDAVVSVVGNEKETARGKIRWGPG